ncbi:MAG: hypothetical protein Q8O77_19680 [Rheinheimera sp.]|nr:hypothetical protein [Rheinheimera sp.]MDP2717033.1 hypothetical protein [Rheinheimera sp.]
MPRQTRNIISFNFVHTLLGQRLPLLPDIGTMLWVEAGYQLMRQFCPLVCIQAFSACQYLLELRLSFSAALMLWNFDCSSLVSSAKLAKRQ